MNNRGSALLSQSVEFEGMEYLDCYLTKKGKG